MMHAREAVAKSSMELKDSDDSLLETLSVSTCTEEFTDFVPLPAIDYKILFSVSVSGIGILPGEFTTDGALRFHLPAIYIVLFAPIRQEEMIKVNIGGEAKFPNLEWKYLMQMRFRVGTCESITDRVVDSDFFELGKRYPPIAIRIGDENIRRVRIEMKFVEMFHNYLPKFEYGDITLKFKNETLHVYKALLSLHSNYMAEKLKYAEEDDVVDMGESDANDFKELLYQIYPTKRPIWANLKGLARAAVDFQANGIIDRITAYIVNYESMYMEQKITEAIKLELPNAIEELVYKAEQDGYWTAIIRNGLNPELEYGEAIYNDIILPAIAKAKLLPLGTPVRDQFFKEINFRNPPKNANDNDTVVLIVNGTKLYVNKGIMKVNNDTMFARSNKGEMIAQVSGELAEECAKINKTPLQVIEVLLQHIHPQKKPIENILLRPLLVFCSTYRMENVINSIENYLIEEPPISPERFMEYFELAEKYNLENLLRRNLHRIENSCRHFALPMINHANFKKLTERTRSQILDRFCSGWAAGGMNPTKRLSRLLTTKASHDNTAAEQDKQLSTFMEIDSLAAFGSSEEVN
uniref:BTB domain-containing protein n=1 Tax=Elaeophora elaphi TaxID=1147741 RepID=A0A158Q6R5_9BILA